MWHHETTVMLRMKRLHRWAPAERSARLESLTVMGAPATAVRPVRPGHISRFTGRRRAKTVL
jgi:hypothetical protein